MLGLEALERELKELIIRTLALEDCTPEDIGSQDALFGDGLGLDSVDALELGVALQKHYGTIVDGDAEETKDHFASVQNLARFVAQTRNQ